MARAGGKVRHGAVALTFDDGPDPERTPLILDILKDVGATAVFFVVGEQASAHPELVRRMAAEGHCVGTHTLSHADLHLLTISAARREIERGRAVVEAILERPVPLFRPPMGHLTLRTALHLRRRRWRTALWTTDVRDWKDGRVPDDVVRDGVGTPDGGVILLHDTSEVAVHALPALIDRLRERNLELVGL